MWPEGVLMVKAVLGKGMGLGLGKREESRKRVLFSHVWVSIGT